MFASGLTYTNAVSALAFDASGNLFAANYGTSTITEITPGGVASVFATNVPNLCVSL